VTNSLATLAIPIIVPHKTSFVISKDGLAFLEDIAKSHFYREMLFGYPST
jgi:hypothetical protein